MYKRDLLTDITVRAAGVKPLTPAFPRASTGASIEERFDVTREALKYAYPFLWNGSERMTRSERAQYDGLFVWLAQTFATDGAHASRHDVVQLFALTSLMECNDQLWPALAAAAGSTPAFMVNETAALLRSSRADGVKILSHRLSADVVQVYLDAAAVKNWKSLQSVVQYSWHDFWLPLKQQACASLYNWDRPVLQTFFEDEQDFFEVATYVLHAPIEQSLQLATASNNWTLKFWAVFHSAQQAATGQATYPEAWTCLLAEAAQLPQEWDRWLAVFNQYPMHYPQLQNVLGEILSSISDAAIDAYMASLADSEGNRQQIAATLTCFRERASLSQRQRVWTAAYQRWLQWDFGCTALSQYVGNVKRSAFDFPVMGYLTECLDAPARAAWGEKLRSRAAAIDREWYADITVISTERFKLISSYQLLTHADHVTSGSIDWLAESPLHRPAWEDGSLYRALRYEFPFGQPTFLEQPKMRFDSDQDDAILPAHTGPGSIA